MTILRKNNPLLSETLIASNTSDLDLSFVASSYINHYIFVKTNRGHERINYSDILYIRAGGSYTDIVSKTKSYVISATLKSVIEQLDSQYIKRCHRSYAVNINKVTFYNEVSLEIETDKKEIQIPISMTYRSILIGSLRRLRSK